MPIPMRTFSSTRQEHLDDSNQKSTFYNDMGDGTKAAKKLAVSDGGLWVSPNGSDSFDGLSGGSAKLTVQAAINALPSGGGKVNVLKGTFTSGTITPVSGLHLVGQGWGSILKLANGTNPVRFIGTLAADAPTNDVIIENLQIDGNKANNTTDGRAILLHGKNITVQNNYVLNSPCSSIQTSADTARQAGGAGRHRILNNYCLNPGRSGTFWGAIACTGGDGVVIANNIAESTDGFMNYAYDVEPDVGWAVSDVLIANNISRGGTITVTGQNGTVTDVTIVGNQIDALGNAGASAGMRIQSVLGRVLIGDNDVKSPAHTSPALTVATITDPQVIGNRLSGMGVEQNTYPDNVGLYLYALTGGFIDGNFITAAAATHATAIAGIKEDVPVGGTVYGINGFRNITVKGKTTQQAANPDTSGATLAALETEVNELKALLRAYGQLPT